MLFYTKCYVAIVCVTLMLCAQYSYINAETGTNSQNKVNHDEDTWYDPGDMLADISALKSSKIEEKPSTNQEEKHDKPKQQTDLPPVKSKVKKVKAEKHHLKNCEMPYFKQLTRFVLETLEKSSIIQASTTQVQMLEDFKNGHDNDEAIYDVLEIIFGIFNQLQSEEKWRNTIWSGLTFGTSYINKEVIAVSFIISVLTSIFLVFESRTSMSWQKQFWYILMVMFVISIPWEWFRMYRQAFAQKQATVMKEGDALHCFPSNMTVLQSLSLWMTNLVSWKQDECGRFQEAILVDPVWEVSPSQVGQAFSITVTRFFAKPLEYIAEAFGRSLNKLFIQLPIQWQPLMFITIVLLFTLCLLLLTNSRIKLGLFEIGPVPQNVQPRKGLQNADLKKLEDGIVLRLQNNLERGRDLPHAGKGRLIIPQKEAVEQKEATGANFVAPESQTPIYDLPLEEVENKVQDLPL